MLFEGMAFKLAAGDILELRGPNGAGKSTLLRILAGLTRPMAGEVRCVGGPARDPGEAGEGPARHYLGHADAIKPNETAR